MSALGSSSTGWQREFIDPKAGESRMPIIRFVWDKDMGGLHCAHAESGREQLEAGVGGARVR